jgi:Carboxypeptidase regulatory-like domain
MSTDSISARVLLLASVLMTILGLLGTRTLSLAQTANTPQASTTAGNYRISGTVVSKIDGHPLARTRITLRDAKAPQKFESLITSDDGKFEFTGVPAGKYDLHGAKRGFISASYDQHEQFSTALVTGAGLETESLVLRLAPAAIIAGKVLDEAGDPVRRATVTLYYDDHTSGVDQIRQANGAQTDDQGAFEMPSLMPGTYFLSTNAKPWYATHPMSEPTNSGSEPHAAPQILDRPSLDRSLDVAYPVTYYPDVTDADSATPIPIRGGERLQVEIHLNPVPALRLLFRVPKLDRRTVVFPQLEQPAFDTSTFVQNDGIRPISPGLVEITGVPAGHYNIRLNGPGTTAIQMNGVDLSKDGDEIDTSTGEALSTVKVSVQVNSETALPPQLFVVLRSAHRSMAGGQQVNDKGEAEFQQIPAGRYEPLLFGSSRAYSVLRISAEGAEVSGHTIIVAPGSSPSVSLTLVGGSLNVEGTAKRGDKPFAGAMVVLVPKDPENNRDLFRRDQSDLDGTFSLLNAVPGSYTVLAIENGWDLDWSQPAVIAAYLKHGRTIQIGSSPGRPMNLSEAVEVQSK